MKSNWQTKKIEDFVKMTYGKNLPASKFMEEGYPVFGANGVIGKYKEYLYLEPKLLVSCRGANSGSINICPPKSFVTNNSIILNLPDEDDIERKFYYYQLLIANKSKIISGSAQPQVTISNLSDLEVNVLESHEQKVNLVNTLDTLFSKIDAGEESLRQVEKQLEVYRQAVLKKAFDLNSKLVCLSEIGNWYGGGTPSRSNEKYWNDGAVNWITPKDMKETHLTESSEKMTELGYSSKSLHLAKKNSILFVVRSGILRRTFPVAINLSPSTVNQDLKILEVTDPQVIPEYVLYYFIARNSILRQELSKDGTTVESIDFNKLRRVIIPIPSKETQEEILNTAKKVSSIVQSVQEQISRQVSQSKLLRQSILKKAFSGELI